MSVNVRKEHLQLVASNVPAILRLARPTNTHIRNIIQLLSFVATHTINSTMCVKTDFTDFCIVFCKNNENN